jgi:acyl carrier protein
MAAQLELERRASGGRVSARSRFQTAMVAWLNARFASKGIVITADTPLFARGVIDSLGILELIAWTELNTGQIVPDECIRMDNFGTVTHIAQMFVREEAYANG